MMRGIRNRRGWSPGEGKGWIYLWVALTVIAIFVILKTLPVYRTKWALEEEMERQMARLASLGEEGIKDVLADYCKLHNLDFDPKESCTLEGERCQPGTMTCSYSREVDYWVYKKTFFVTVSVHLDKIPCDSF